MSCIIVGCKSHSSREENDAKNVSFHRFPTDVGMRQKWFDAIARTNWEWKKQHRICSKRFIDDCFINIGYKWRRLKANAVPSLHLRKEIVPVSDDMFSKSQADFPEVPISIDIPSTSEFPSPSSATSTAAVSSSPQHNALIYEIAQLKQDLEKVKKTAQRRLLKINSLRQKTKRLSKKNCYLNIRLMDLLQKEKIENENLLLLECVKNNPIIEKYLSKQLGDNTREYSLELRKFAVTLNYLSPRAYSYN